MEFYYTVEIEIENNNFVTGNKDVKLYKIEDNKPIQIFEFEAEEMECPIELINQYLDSHGYNSEECILTCL